jgi:hypothetical protein
VAAVECAQQQRAVRVGAGLVLGDAALVDQPLHERVVGGELAHLAVAQQVGAGVADVGQAHLVAAVEHDRGDRRAHALDARVLLDDLAEPVVGPLHRARQRGEHVVGVVAAVQPAHRLHGDRGGEVAGGRAAHAVGDHQQLLAGEAGVLVVLPDPADV